MSHSIELRCAGKPVQSKNLNPQTLMTLDSDVPLQPVAHTM